MAKQPRKNATEFEIDVDPTELGLEALDKQLASDAEGEEARMQTEEELQVDVELEEKSPKSDYVDIFVDEVEGMPNFEVVGVNGVVYRIKRGEVTSVPAAVVHVLKNAIATRTIQTRDPITGMKKEEFRNYSPIPWRKV